MPEPTLPEDASIHERLMAKLQKQPEEAVEPEPIEDSTDTQPIESEEVEDDAVEETADSEEDVTTESDTITLDDLATYAGLESDRLDIDDDGRIMFKAKVDGKIEVVPLKEALDNYQIASHLRKENTEVVELKKQLKAQLEESNAKTQQKLDEAEAIVAAAYHHVMQDFESTNWAELKAEDPNLYLIKKGEMEDKKKAFIDAYQQIQNKKPTVDPNTIRDQIIQARTKFAESIPEWSKSPDAALKEWNEMNQYAQLKGYSEDQFLSVIDPIVLTLLRNSMQYEKLMQEQVKVTKQVRTAPKIVKSGNKPAPSKNDAELKRLQANVKAGKPGAIAELLLKKGIVK